MTETARLKPELYGDGPQPSLSGGACTCGYVFFPMQRYGCERCGRYGEHLTARALAGRGRLVASAVVHIHFGERPAPFVVGAIALEDGPVVRTLLAGTETALTPGTPMVTTLVPIAPGEDGAPRVDLRFTAES